MHSTSQIIIHKGFLSYEIIAGNDPRTGLDIIHFSSRSSARVFLSSFLNDYFTVSRLRQLVQGAFDGTYLRRTNDQTIVDQVADLLVLGSLRIAMLPCEMPTWSRMQFIVAETTAPSLELSPAPTPEEPQEVPVSPAIAAQADTLKRASASGTPFCET